MAKLIPLFARFGLFAPKADACDTFDLRLTRIGSREARARKQGPMFKNRSAFKNLTSRPAAAALA